MTRIILLTCIICLYSCHKTPDPDYLPVSLEDETLAPWDAPVYSEIEMSNFFSNSDYSSLVSLYVSPSGSDQNGDGSVSNPYLTIAHAIEQDPLSGVIIRVKAGVYKEHFSVSVIGTKDLPFVIYSEDGPGAATLDGENADNAIVKIIGEHNVIDGFEIINSTGYGIQIGKESDGSSVDSRNSFAVIRNVEIHSIGRDIIKSGKINYLLIEGCEIYDCTNTVQYDNAIDGVAVYYSLCRNNLIHDISPGFGGYFKGGSHNNIWSANVFKDIGDLNETDVGGAIQLGGSGSFTWRDNQWYDYPSGHEQSVYNNLFINCPSGAVTFTSCWNSQVYNNSMLNCGYSGMGQDAPIVKSLFRVRVTQSSNQASAGLKIYNNVSFHQDSYETEYFFIDQGVSNTLGTISHGYNSIYNDLGSFEWGFPDGILNSDESILFLYLNDSLEVDISSPIVNAGYANNLVLFDRLGQTRPIGVIDRGAYEK